MSVVTAHLAATHAHADADVPSIGNRREANAANRQGDSRSLTISDTDKRKRGTGGPRNLPRWLVRHLVACPKCRAWRGHDCRIWMGRGRSYRRTSNHIERVRAARELKANGG